MLSVKEGKEHFVDILNLNKSNLKQISQFLNEKLKGKIKIKIHSKSL